MNKTHTENRRKIFHIDVGDMSPQQIKQYLRQIKKDLKNKTITPKEKKHG